MSVCQLTVSFACFLYCLRFLLIFDVPLKWDESGRPLHELELRTGDSWMRCDTMCILKWDSLVVYAKPYRICNRCT